LTPFFVSAVKAAEAELQAAVDALKAEEEAYQGKIRALEDVIAKESGMKQAKAKNELAQLKGEDPLPLRRAKITQEAALRKVQKQRKLAEEAEAEAAAKKKALEEAERALEATVRDLAQKEGSISQASLAGRGFFFGLSFNYAAVLAQKKAEGAMLYALTPLFVS
jgi:chromosome segregation ATPase